jgi:hypothetical protein
MTFKVNSVQGFIDNLARVCLQNNVQIPSQFQHKPFGKHFLVQLEDTFISKLNKANPRAVDELYKISCP